MGDVHCQGKPDRCKKASGHWREEEVRLQEDFGFEVGKEEPHKGAQEVEENDILRDSSARG